VDTFDRFVGYKTQLNVGLIVKLDGIVIRDDSLNLRLNDHFVWNMLLTSLSRISLDD